MKCQTQSINFTIATTKKTQMCLTCMANDTSDNSYGNPHEALPFKCNFCIPSITFPERLQIFLQEQNEVTLNKTQLDKLLAVHVHQTFALKTTNPSYSAKQGSTYIRESECLIGMVTLDRVLLNTQINV